MGFISLLLGGTGSLLPETPVVFCFSAKYSVILPLLIGASVTIWPNCPFYR